MLSLAYLGNSSKTEHFFTAVYGFRCIDISVVVCFVGRGKIEQQLQSLVAWMEGTAIPQNKRKAHFLSTIHQQETRYYSYIFCAQFGQRKIPLKKYHNLSIIK